MSQLILSSQPSFTDLPDSALAAGQALTDATMLALAHNSKFATVRGKLIFMGFYACDNIVPPPVDPDDGYVYSLAECQFISMIYSNRSPAPGFVPGQATPPAQAALQPGLIYNFGGWSINDLDGVVATWTGYISNGVEVLNSDGILKVYAICSRKSVTSRPGNQIPPNPIPTPPTSASTNNAGLTASVGSGASPVILFTVGGAPVEIMLTASINVVVPPTETLDADGQYAGATVALIFGTSPAAAGGSGEIVASGASGGPNTSVPNGEVVTFGAPAGTMIWYYTIWTVDPLLPAGASYEFSITLAQGPV